MISAIILHPLWSSSFGVELSAFQNEAIATRAKRGIAQIAEGLQFELFFGGQGTPMEQD